MFVSRRFVRLALLVALMVSVLSFTLTQAQEPTTLNIYVDADTNITDWLCLGIAPMLATT